MLEQRPVASKWVVRFMNRHGLVFRVPSLIVPLPIEEVHRAMEVFWGHCRWLVAQVDPDSEGTEYITMDETAVAFGQNVRLVDHKDSRQSRIAQGSPT